MPIEHINKTDTLNEGRVKLNAAIDGANAADVTSQEADVKATQALANSESTQTQLDTIVIDGDSSVEAAQARVDEKGDSHSTLKDRIDDGFTKTNAQLADTVLGINNNTINPIYDGGVLIAVEEKNEDNEVVRSVSLGFDGGLLKTVTEFISGDSVKSTLHYTSGTLTSVEKEVL